MAHERNLEADNHSTESLCLHLRSKAMYVRGTREGLEDANPVAHENCWCNLTQHIIGPDNEDVEHHRCVQGRTCFKPV